MSNSVWPHRQQPTRLRCPWDSPGKNTGVGCHFLLWCMKVKSESEVTQSCPTLRDPMDCSPPGSSVHVIFQARVLEWDAIAFSDHVTLLRKKTNYWPMQQPGWISSEWCWIIKYSSQRLYIIGFHSNYTLKIFYKQRADQWSAGVGGGRGRSLWEGGEYGCRRAAWGNMWWWNCPISKL